MTVFFYIAVSMSFGLISMLSFQASMLYRPIRLVRCLVMCCFYALVHSLAFWLGYQLGCSLRFSDGSAEQLFQRYNELVFVGLMVIVAIRWIFARRLTAMTYNFSRWSTSVAWMFASSFDLLFVGLGCGFVETTSVSLATILLPVFFFEALLALLGAMIGRQHLSLNVRRWRWIAVLLLLSATFFSIL